VDKEDKEEEASTKENEAAGKEEPKNKEGAEMDLMFDSILLYVIVQQ
jgi:hypothetical protein